MCDVVRVDNVATLSGVEEKSGLVIMGLQEEHVIAVEMMEQIKNDCISGFVVVVNLLQQKEMKECLRNKH